MTMKMLEECMKFARKDACCVHIEFDAQDENGETVCVGVGDPAAIIFQLANFITEFAEKQGVDVTDVLDDLGTAILMHMIRKEKEANDGE